MEEYNPIQMLMDEHEVIVSSEIVIRRIDKLWEKDEKRYESAVRSLLVFFREYSDQFHHHKEEEILFPEMANLPGPAPRDIIMELEEHHEQFRESVAKIEQSLDAGQWELTQRGLQQYLNDLLDHIAIENDEVFIMAMTSFSEPELERMYFRFKDLDNSLGEERKQELTALINQLHQ